MIPLALPFPDIDPVAFSIGPASIRWYGLAYMVGLVLGWLYIRRLLTEISLWPAGKPPFGLERVDDLLIYVTVGVILGGRLGYVLFYEPSTYLTSPADVFKVWKGGMSFHGAIVGSAAAIWLFARQYGVNMYSTMDLCAAANPIGLFFGRIANYINGELWGRASDASWATVFCNSATERHYGGACPAELLVPRHPSQLYEAALEGIALFLVLRFLTHHRGALKQPGIVIGVFLAGYGVARIICEVFREPHAGHPLNIGPFTAGMFYCVPLILLGLYFVSRARSGATAAKGSTT
ncbi:MAG: prolipoprotein diacylglyceryl transferase [Hyphomicrobium sp.]